MSSELVALKQWEADTGSPASASEGNAFIDGYRDGQQAAIAAERKRCADATKMSEALLKAHAIRLAAIGRLGIKQKPWTTRNRIVQYLQSSVLAHVADAIQKGDS